MKNKNKSGVTLVGLIITVLIMLILAAITISMFTGADGVFEKIRKSSFVADMKNYQEAAIVITQSNYIDFVIQNGMIIKINVGLDGQDGIETVLDKIKNEYKDQVIIQDNKMYYKYNDTEISQKRVQWCFENNIPVWGYDTYDDFKKSEGITEEPNKLPLQNSEYIKVGNTYLNSPDISKLNPHATYYITYDENGQNPTIAGRIDTIEPPINWYDYENKMWANIVTLTEENVAYWVWIPRYVYKLDSVTETADVKFVSVNDEYKDSTDATVTLSDEYHLAEAFTFGDQENPSEREQLTGYWMAKYEISEEGPSTHIQFSRNYIDINIIETTATDATYKIFVNGEFLIDTTLPYTVTGLQENKEYDVSVFGSTGVSRNSFLNTYNTVPVAPDISNLNKEVTYYVTYDDNGNNLVVSEDSIAESPTPPANWYDYSRKKWANIVTKNNGLVAYWVWVPRYVYKLDGISEYADIRFVSTNNICTATNGQIVSIEGFNLPEAFTFGDEENSTARQQLTGYWISKYELSE